jgi:uncharacterized membrane protein
MKNKFLLCGLIGWCMEILWTGLESFRRRELALVGRSSIWMFPIYGMASFLSPISKWIKNKNAIFRGGIYAVCIFAGEFFTGTLLKKYDLCPWDYSRSKLHFKGLIRLDYAPLWFFVGLFFEKLFLKHHEAKKSSKI